jgi:hypothetical protein
LRTWVAAAATSVRRRSATSTPSVFGAALRRRSAIVTWSPSKFVIVRSSRMAVRAATAAPRVLEGEKSES